MDVETGAYKLLIIAVIGVALVIVAGINYTNYNNNRVQLVNSNVPNGILSNYTTNAGSISNTSASNSNYAYYILFMALILGVLIGALVSAAKKKQG